LSHERNRYQLGRVALRGRMTWEGWHWVMELETDLGGVALSHGVDSHGGCQGWH